MSHENLFRNADIPSPVQPNFEAPAVQVQVQAAPAQPIQYVPPQVPQQVQQAIPVAPVYQAAPVVPAIPQAPVVPQDRC